MAYYCENSPDFYTEKLTTARKQHKCCETSKIIQPGEKYWRCVGKWDGKVDTMIQCRAAYHLCRFLNFREGECIILFGGLTEHLGDMWFDDDDIKGIVSDIRAGTLDFDSEEAVGKEIERRKAKAVPHA